MGCSLGMFPIACGRWSLFRCSDQDSVQIRLASIKLLRTGTDVPDVEDVVEEEEEETADTQAERSASKRFASIG